MNSCEPSSWECGFKGVLAISREKGGDAGSLPKPGAAAAEPVGLREVKEMKHSFSRTEEPPAMSSRLIREGGLGGRRVKGIRGGGRILGIRILLPVCAEITHVARRKETTRAKRFLLVGEVGKSIDTIDRADPEETKSIDYYAGDLFFLRTGDKEKLKEGGVGNTRSAKSEN